MKNIKKILCVVLAIVCVAAAFAGCSSKSNDDSKDKAKSSSTAKVKVIDIELSSEEYAFGVDKNQPELKEKCNELLKEMKSNGELDKISNNYFGNGTPQGVASAKKDDSKDQLVVATNAEFKPFEYKEGDKFYGIDMEIANLLAKKLNKELVIVDMAFDAVLLSVQQQKADIGMAGLTVNPERAKQVDFSDSYYSASQKRMLTRFSRALTQKHSSAAKQAQQVSHMFKAAQNSALTSSALHGRAMQTALLLFRI